MDLIHVIIPVRRVNVLLLPFDFLTRSFITIIVLFVFIFLCLLYISRAVAYYRCYAARRFVEISRVHPPYIVRRNIRHITCLLIE